MNNDAGVEDIYNLTPLQKGMLFHGLYAPESCAYWEQLSVTFSGDLDPAVFRRSWLDVVAHHTALRTHFHWEELDEPLQIVQRAISLPWHEEDWRSLSPTEFADRLRGMLDVDRRRGFEFSKPPLMRFYLIRGPESRFTFIWSHHHILLDGWSGAVIFRDVLTLYAAHRRGDVARLARPRPFRDYVLWLQEQDDASARAFWQKHLQGVEGPTRLRAGELTLGDSQMPQRYRQEVRSLEKSTTELVRSFLRHQRLTLNTLIQGAWSLLLSHYSGEFEVVFGTVVSGRPPALRGAEDMVGLLINTIPVRVSLDPGADVLPWLRELQAAQIERDRHAHISLAEILSATGLPRDTPLFESIVSVENYPVSALLGPDPSRVHIEHVEAFEQTNYPLAIVVSPDDERITLKITADADRFEPATLQRLLGHLCNLMAGAVEYPTAKLVYLTLEPSSETVLPAGTSSVVEMKPDACVLRGFELQEQRTPQAVAAICSEESLTYQELNERANRLARYLRENGVGRNVLVGICANRSLDTVTALLAVLKAGGAYVPLDPNYPLERLRFMLADAEITLVLADASVEAGKELIVHSPTARLVNLSRQEELLAKYGADNLNGDTMTGQELAYVIYTSGSTGRPKGVMITHSALLNHMRWMIGEFSFGESVRVLQKTSFSFDASVWEFLLPLMCGGTLVLARPNGHLDPDYLINVIVTQQIRVLQGVPSILELLVEHEGFGACVSLTHVFSGGEVLTELLRRRLQARISATVCNLYGPTEACIDATFHVCARDGGPNRSGDVPIGRPIANTFVRVRDVWGHMAPVGGVGELLIGGEGLARGYWNRPDLTEEKFILDPPSGRRMYRTGDLVQRRSDGALQFVGRLDQQVKLRGYRIELGEIENIVEQCPEVSRVVVVVRADDAARPFLVAYVTSSGSHEGLAKSVRATMKRLLPYYMAPADCVVLDQFPQTPNGKVDRRLLSSWPLRATTSNQYDAPATETEQQLAAIWQEVLNRKNPGPADDFFQLGGHSLTAMQVLSRIQEVFHVKIPLRTLFELPRLSELARRIETYQAARIDQSAPEIYGGDVEEISL